MTEYRTWLSFGKALLAGGLAYLGVRLVQAVHGRTKRLTRHRLETALAAARPPTAWKRNEQGPSHGRRGEA